MSAIQETARETHTLEGPGGLTEKQCEVLELLLEHKSIKEIALAVGISPSAVEQRLASARLRLGTQRRGDTARAYLRLKATCGKTTGGDPQVFELPARGQEGLEDETDGLLLLRDVGVSGSYPLWPVSEAPRESLRDLTVPASPFVRIGLIIVFSLLIAVVALVGMSVTQSIASLIEQ